MRNEDEKIELEREVSELENQVYDLTGYRNNRNELKGQYANNKRDYKRFNRKVTRIKGIRNLKVMGNVALFLVPFVVCGSVFAGSFVGWDALISSTRTVDFGDEAKIVSMDSAGGYDEKLNRFGCNDSITINTKWFKENENLVRYTYEVEEGIDFHTKEEIENVVFWPFLP